MLSGAEFLRSVEVAATAPVIFSCSRSKSLYTSYIPQSVPRFFRRRFHCLSYCFPFSLSRSVDRSSDDRGRFSLGVMSFSSSSIPSYQEELAAAKKAASLASKLCQKVQKSFSQSDVQSKADKSPVTVADYGSQALVSLVLKIELPHRSFSLVAEEDSGDLRKDGAQNILGRITKLVNETLTIDGTYKLLLSEEDILDAIDSGKSDGGPYGQHWVLDPIDGTKGQQC